MRRTREMNSPVTSFNPARFNDQIDEALYARAWGPGARLKRERKDLVTRLRKKANGNEATLALADKLEGCKPGHRCKSAACPECSHAARQLVTQVTQRFLSDQPSSDTIVCVSIVPADGASKPGNLASPARTERPALERSARPRWRDLVHRRKRLVASTSTTRTVTPATGPITCTGLRQPPIRKSSRRRCSGSSRRPT